MDRELTVDDFDRLSEVQSTQDPAVFTERLEQLHEVKLYWTPPGDDAEFMVNLKLLGPCKSEYVELIFSERGNLVLLRVRGSPVISVDLVAEMLEMAGWRVVYEDQESLVINKWNETVFRLFFEYT